MPTGQEFGEVLRDLAEYIEASGREIVSQNDGETDGGEPVSIFDCKQGDHHFQVFGVQDGTSEYFTVRYPYQASKVYASRYAIEQKGIEPGPDTKVQISQDEVEGYLDQLASNNKREYKMLGGRLRETINTPHNRFRIDKTSNGAITFFQIDRRIFPYQEAFNISDFNEAVQIVISVGLEGRLLIEDAYQIREGIEAALSDDGGVEASNDDNLRYIS